MQCAWVQLKAREGSMAASIKVSVYTNSDDAFVAWAPSEFIPGCRGFLLERERKTDQGQKVDIVENRVGFARDNPKSGEHKPSNEWPFQRFICRTSTSRGSSSRTTAAG